MYKIVIPKACKTCMNCTGCEKANQDLVSILAIKHAVTYVPQQVVYPKFGKLFCYKTIKDCENEKIHNPDWQIWECETTNPQPIDNMISINESDFQDYWKHKPIKVTIVPNPSTILVDSVKLIARVK